MATTRRVLRAAAVAGVLALTVGVVAVSPVVAQSNIGAEPLTGLDLYMPVPPGPAARPEAAALGRLLFFEPALSRDSSLACASCHRPDRAFSNDKPVSVGVFGRRGIRNVPAILNRGWGEAFFWDGRIETLEEQVLQPIIAPAEMGMTIAEAVERLAAAPEYAVRFRQVFGREVDAETLAAALAAYVRSIRAGDSPFDRAVAGEPVLSALERRGLELFQGRAHCVRCHVGPLLSDEDFHNTGVAWRTGAPADSGRALVTGRSEDVGAFKTPTLREVERTSPYMHDGSLETLEDVVEFYDSGGHPNPELDPILRPLGLSPEDRAALIAFLRTLSGRIEEGPEAGSPRAGPNAGPAVAVAAGN